MSWRDALDAAIDAATDVVDPAPLVEARRWLDEPWRIVVIGRVASGKTTWINRVAGGDGATGLGGVTMESREIDAGGWMHVDTPGIDDPDRAILGLQPLVDGADAAVWVVDGLQPLTASERDVAAAVLGDIRLSVVVTKADLVDEGDREAVLARVRDLTAELEPVSVRFVNAREAERLPPLPGPPRSLSARRLQALRAAIAAIREALPPPPPDRAAVEAMWARTVRHHVQQIEQAIAREAIRDVGAALRELAEAAEPARRALRAELPSWLLPVLPGPDVDVGPPTASGADAARRAVTAAAARWLAEGQLVLREWWAEGPEPTEAVARHARFVDALAELETSLLEET